MRFLDKKLSAGEVQTLFECALDQGVNGCHISHEYTSFELCCKAYRNLSPTRLKTMRIIAKLSSPHFKEDAFDKHVIEDRVDNVLHSTGTESIAIVQWMWRMNPLVDDIRCQKTKDQKEEIIASFSDLKAKGKVGEFACFPYTTTYMELVDNIGVSHIHVNYLNFWERNAIDVDVKCGIIVLRPFGGARAFSMSENDKNLLDRSLGHQNIVYHSLALSLLNKSVVSVVVGMNTPEQICAIASCANAIEPDDERFSRYNSFAGRFSH